MKYLQIDLDGNILSIAEPVEGFSLIAPENSIALEASTPVDLELNYWDYDTSTLATRDPKPGYYYYWANKSWNLNSILLAQAIRVERNLRLSTSDWTQFNDSPLTPEQKSAWATYRQELRDITDNLTGSETTIEDAPWPTQPS